MIFAFPQLVCSVAAADSPILPPDEPAPVGQWWGAAVVMFFAVVLIGIGVWLIQYWHRKHDERRGRSAGALGFESITDEGDAVGELCEQLATLRLRLDRRQLRSAHRGELEGWTVTYVDARERDGHHMALGWSGDGQVEPCPRSLVLLEREDMDLPEVMLEPDNVVYRLARGELKQAKQARDTFERNNRVAVGGAQANALLSDDLRAHLAENRELTVRGAGPLIAVSTDTKHVPDRHWHSFLARAMTIAEAIREAAEDIGPQRETDDAEHRRGGEALGSAATNPAEPEWAAETGRLGRLR